MSSEGKRSYQNSRIFMANHRRFIGLCLQLIASHSLSVGLDSLYTAYLKANYPFEFYATCLEYYSSEEKRDLTKVAQLKKELKAFNINLESLKYGKNNSGFVIDMENNLIGQSLSGVKGVNAKIGQEMYYIYNNLKIHDIIDLICEVKENENLSINKKHWSVLASIKYFDTIDKYKKVELLPELYDILYKKQFKMETIVSINKKLAEMFAEHKVNPVFIDMEMIKKYKVRETAKLTYIDNQKELIRDVYNMIECIEYNELEYILNTYKCLGYVGDDVNTPIMDVKAVSVKKGSALLYNPITENEKWVLINPTGLKKGMQVIILEHSKKGKEINITNFIKLGGK